MIPVHLRISGFLSYFDPVDLDFTQFDLACISGSNGAGKSSLLDAITWVLFGQARRRDDTIINNHAKSAEVIFDFQYESNLFRVLRTKPREKTTILEFYVWDSEGVWRPLTEKSVNKTEARIQSTLHLDYDTFINASFFLQGKADQFSQQRPGDRKRVLSNILGLEVWERYRETTAERRRDVENEVKVLDGQLDEIESELAQEESRLKRMEEAEIRLSQVQTLCQAKEAVLANLQRLAASLDEQKRLVDVLARGLNEAQMRLDRMKNQYDGLQGEKAAYLGMIEREEEVVEAYKKMMDLRASLAAWDEIAKNFNEIEARRSTPIRTIAIEEARLQQELQVLKEQENQIKREEEMLPELNAQRSNLAEQMDHLEKSLAGKRSLEEELQAQLQKAADARAENQSLRETMNLVKERIDRLNQVEGANCPLCGQPLSSSERENLIASLLSEGKEMGDHYRANQDLLGQSENRVRELQNSIKQLTYEQEEYNQLLRRLDRLDVDLVRIGLDINTWRQGGIERGAGRLADIERRLLKGDFALEARSQLAEIDAEAKLLGYDAAEHDQVRRLEQNSRLAEQEMRALDSARASLAPLTRQVEELENQLKIEEINLNKQREAYHSALAKYEKDSSQLPDINQAEREVFDLQAESNRLRMEVGMVRQSVAVLSSQRERKMRLQTRREQLSLQVARYKTLERAFSKDGVPALLIEQALPEIETQANDILDRLSAGNMSVQFETQKQYKDKSRDDRRETLDIMISDSAGIREYELFSGGEAFRVNFAIRLALSRVLAQRAGARLQTLVIDEGFGSQDSQGKQRIIEAINQVRSEFAKIIVITHLEELKEAFPARIEVEKGARGSQLRVVA